MKEWFLRYLQGIATGLGLITPFAAAATLVVVLSGQRSPPTTITANRFVLTDQTGTERGRWEITNRDHSRLVFLDKRGREKFQVVDAGEGVFVFLRQDTLGVSLGASPLGGASIQVDGLYRQSARLEAFLDGAFVRVFDRSGNPRAMFGTSDVGPTLSFGAGSKRPQLAISEVNGQMHFMIFDKNGDALFAAPR